MQFGVQSISVGSFEEPGPAVYWQSHWDEWIDLRLQLVLIRGGLITALVNTALPDDLSALHAEYPTAMMFKPEGERGALSRRRPDELQRPALAAAGVTPEDVTHVIVNPLVRYTTETLDEFPNAQLCFSKRGWVHYQTTHRHPHDSRAAFSRDILVHLVTDWWDRVRLLDDEDEIAPGLRTWHSGVHHRGSMVVEVDTVVGVVAISDSFFVYENIEGDRPLGLNESFEETFRTYERVRRSADHAIPLYDGAVFDRYPGGVVAPVPGPVPRA